MATVFIKKKCKKSEKEDIKIISIIERFVVTVIIVYDNKWSFIFFICITMLI